MKNRLLIEGARIVADDRVTAPSAVLVEDGQIAAVGQGIPVPDGIERVDGRGCYLLPAFVELHAHGGGGYDFADGTEEAARAIFQTHLAHGVTLLCPTLMASAWSDTMAFLRFCDGTVSSLSGFGGVHLEGPFLSPVMRGAQNGGLLITPTEARISELSEMAHLLSRVTVAPELKGVEALARELTRRGVGLSVGHSNADAPAMERAVSWGFTSVTHLYSSTSRRAKQGSFVIGGIEECALLEDRLTVELIGDGHHVCRESFLLTERCKGRDGIVLVSDAMRAAGQGEDVTESYLGRVAPENRVLIEDGVAKLPDRSSFAGSVAVGDTMVAALCGRYGLPLPTVSHMMSAVPCALLGLRDRGRIAVGQRAELTLLNEQYQTVAVISGGRKVYEVSYERKK